MAQVRCVAYTADGHAGAMPPAERDGQPGPRGHRHVVPVCGKFLAHPGRPLSRTAGQLLIVIDSYEDDNPREKMPGPLDDVEMTDRNEVEAVGIDRKLPQPVPAGRIEPKFTLAGQVSSPFSRRWSKMSWSTGDTLSRSA